MFDLGRPKSYTWPQGREGRIPLWPPPCARDLWRGATGVRGEFPCWLSGQLRGEGGGIVGRPSSGRVVNCSPRGMAIRGDLGSQCRLNVNPGRAAGGGWRNFRCWLGIPAPASGILQAGNRPFQPAAAFMPTGATPNTPGNPQLDPHRNLGCPRWMGRKV